MKSLFLSAVALVALSAFGLQASPILGPPVTACSAIPGVTGTANDLIFTFGLWSVPGFACEQQDKIYSNFALGTIPTDATLRIQLQPLGTQEFHTADGQWKLRNGIHVFVRHRDRSDAEPVEPDYGDHRRYLEPVESWCAEQYQNRIYGGRRDHRLARLHARQSRRHDPAESDCRSRDGRVRSQWRSGCEHFEYVPAGFEWRNSGARIVRVDWRRIAAAGRTTPLPPRLKFAFLPDRRPLPEGGGLFAFGDAYFTGWLARVTIDSKVRARCASVSTR